MHSEQICPQLTSVVPCRRESDTTDLYCIFDPDTAHRLAGWGRDWHENHRLGQADCEVRVFFLQCQCFLCKSPKSPKLGEGDSDLIVFCRLRRMCWTASSQA